MKETIVAPNLGQQMSFDGEAGDTLRASCVLEPGASVPMHVHLHQHERFEVRAGALEVWVDGERRRCGPGSSATIAPGVAHRFRNLGAAPVEVDISIWPALRTRLLFSRLFALDAEGKLNRAGAPGPLRLGLLTREFGDELFLLARIPPGLQLRAGRLLGRLAVRLGRTA